MQLVNQRADAIATIDLDGGRLASLGVADGPTINWPGALSLAIASTFDHWVIFTEPEHAMCVEPQSGPPNEFHLSLRVIGPGESLVGSMTWRWTIDP